MTNIFELMITGMLIRQIANGQHTRYRLISVFIAALAVFAIFAIFLYRTKFITDTYWWY